LFLLDRHEVEPLGDHEALPTSRSLIGATITVDGHTHAQLCLDEVREAAARWLAAPGPTR
jgi:hypothetical protein